MINAADHLEVYLEEGYILFPKYFSTAELTVLRPAIREELSRKGPQRVTEKDGKAVRSVYGSHASNEIFRRLAHHNRLAGLARHMLGDDVYVYQFKINAKLAFDGDVWEWHQDYIFWQQEDGMREARAVTAVLFLDDVTEFNGPMFLVPGSHKEGVLSPEPLHRRMTSVGGLNPYHNDPEWISNLTAELKYSLDKECVAQVVDRLGIVSAKGEKGTTLFFHPNMVHASPGNISPFNRIIILITYNSVTNIPVQAPNKKPRPEFLCSKDYQPIIPMADDVLLL